MVLQLQDVAFAYRTGCPVVQSVTTSVQPGTLHVLLGPNGCGKTTLLKLMLGQLRPASGSITLDGLAVDRLPAHRSAAWLSYVPQRSAVAFAFTVRQVVAMGRYALPPDPAAVDESIASCDLLDLVDRPCLELSVGQQQRVLLARAFAQSHGEGRVMLLDEPTSGMDLSHVHRTMGQLRRLAECGAAIVIVLQDLNLAARYADRVWLMDKGCMVAQGAWNEVLCPEVLQPVYGVGLTPMNVLGQRPVFDVRPPTV